MRNGFRSLPIRNQIALVFSILFLIIMVGQTASSTIITSNAVGIQANDYILGTLKQTSLRMESLVDSFRMMANTIASNEIITEILVRNNRAAQGKDNYTLQYEDNLKLQKEISQTSIAFRGLNSIQIIAPSYVISYNFVSDSPFNAGELSQRELQRLEESSGGLVLLSTKREPVDKLNAKAKYVFSVSRKLYRFGDHQELGYLFINIQEKIIRSVIEDVSIGTSGTLELFDSEGVVTSARDEDMIGKKLDSGLVNQIPSVGGGGYEIANSVLTAYYFSDSLNWGIITKLPVSEVTASFVRIRQTNLIIGIVGILLAVLASVTFAKQLTKPLESLVESMSQIRANHLDARVKTGGGKELGQLGDTFNDMAEDLNNIIRVNTEIEIVSKEARLRAIQAQINPHFLYNTLDTIYWKLIMENQEEIGELVVSLSEILRYSISGSGERMVSLRRELNVLEHYQQIQDARFKGRIIWRKEVPEECLLVYMPKMLIQPVVENAILHGMDADQQILTILVTASISDGVMELCVSDNGRGIPQERLYTILDTLVQKPSEERSGFGLSGVHRQIQLRFGIDYGLRISSQVGVGTQVIIRIPVLETTEEQ